MTVYKLLILEGKAGYLIFKSHLHNFSMSESDGTLPRIKVTIKSNPWNFV